MTSRGIDYRAVICGSMLQTLSVFRIRCCAPGYATEEASNVDRLRQSTILSSAYRTAVL